MINLKPQVVQKLKETSADDVSYIYPEKWVKGKKLISYYEIDNSFAESADDEEYSSNIAVQIDVWCDTPSEASKLAIEVNKKMKELDLKRTLCYDVPENGAMKFHKTMRFEKEEIILEEE